MTDDAPDSDPRFSARSTAECHLERIHAGEFEELAATQARIDEKQAEIDALEAELVDAKVGFARDIAAHPMMSLGALEVLEALEWELDGLQELFRDLYVEPLE